MFGPQFVENLPYLLMALIPALTFHEYAHAIVAKWYGDNTAQYQGRLTLNPFAHLDPFGTVAIALIGFGWAKPVPIDPRNFRSSWAEFFVAAAGPAMNILLATIFALLFKLGLSMAFGAEHMIQMTRILQISIVLNLSLAIFNLIPLGPLDGHYILARLLPRSTSIRFTDWNSAYGGMVLFGVIIIDQLLRLNILRTIISIPVMLMYRLIM